MTSIYCVYKAIQKRNVVGPGQRSRFLVLTKRSAASGDENEFDVDTFNKDIQYPWKNKESRKLALKEKQNRILKAKDTRALGTSLSIIPELRVLVLTKRHVGSRNEIDNHNSLRLVKKVIASPYNVIFC